MIEQSQQVLLAALRASLTEASFSYPDDIDWDSVIKEAKSQAVIGLISPVLPVHDESIDQVKTFYMRLLYEQNQLLQLFKEHQIPCVILKGCAAAVYYPKPYLRSMGDVDFLVPRDRFDDAMKLMEDNGYCYSHGKGNDGKLAFQSRHIGYYKNGIEYELHHHFSSTGFDMDDILEQSMNQRVYKALNGFSFPMFPEIENGLVLLGHLYQHLNEDNLGLRQLIDWSMYCQSVMDTEKWKKQFVPLAKKIGLYELAVNVTAICEKYLGLSKPIVPNDACKQNTADEVLENIWGTGNFGSKRTSSPESSGERIRKVTGTIKSKGLYSYFRDNGRDSWELCQKHPILKPFAFIYGMFRFVFRGITGILKTGNMKEQFRHAKDKMKYEKDLGLRTKRSKKEK